MMCMLKTNIHTHLSEWNVTLFLAITFFLFPNSGLNLLKGFDCICDCRLCCLCCFFVCLLVRFSGNRIKSSLELHSDGRIFQVGYLIGRDNKATATTKIHHKNINLILISNYFFTPIASFFISIEIKIVICLFQCASWWFSMHLAYSIRQLFLGEFKVFIFSHCYSFLMWFLQSY